MSEIQNLIPLPEPESIEETGLGETTIEHLILKILYFRGELYGQDLSNAIGLKFSVIGELVESLKLTHQIVVKRSMGMGGVGALLALTEAGRARAREHLESNQYAGVAPVPVAQYVEVVRQQKHQDGWLTKEGLTRAFSGMVITERTVSQIGPAIAAANSLLIYGRPGDGKTFLIESLANLETSPVYLPHAIECQGNIIQVFDPIYHTAIDDPQQEPSVLTVNFERGHDKRWLKCKRPFIVSGGELSLDMLDLRFNATSKIYEAPFQLKANNGIYLIDDFGRQRATPAEVLNRWIVPMERRVDYLSFLTGGKLTAPFETFLVFSTNLNPADLGDEAFLRRIQYKMLLRGPAEAEFVQIFERFCAQRQIPCPPGLPHRFIERFYRPTGKAFRRCHPRDVLTHAMNLIHFEKLPLDLNDTILGRAFESCFVQEEEDGSLSPAAPVPIPSPSVQTMPPIPQAASSEYTSLQQA
ncbi:MAG: ATP-binding protein [Acidobacteriia bacterium]|nr:ATP-binding protein [Terriglobia bacterium]